MNARIPLRKRRLSADRTTYHLDDERHVSADRPRGLRDAWQVLRGRYTPTLTIHLPNTVASFSDAVKEVWVNYDHQAERPDPRLIAWRVAEPIHGFNCTRIGGRCVSYHCPHCGKPCSSQGCSCQRPIQHGPPTMGGPTSEKGL